jgi:hypothetical protein
MRIRALSLAVDDACKASMVVVPVFVAGNKQEKSQHNGRTNTFIHARLKTTIDMFLAC